MDSTKNTIVDQVIMADNTWSHAKCEQLIQELKYGNLTITFRVHDARVTDLLCQSFRRYRKSKLGEEG